MIAELATALLALADPAAIDQSATAARTNLVGEVVACRRLQDLPARYACYDRTVGELAEATAREDIVVLDREEVRSTRRSLFGFTLPKLPFANAAKPSDEIRDLETVLRSARLAGHGLWTLVLAEGGTWQTTEPSRQLDPRPGQKIHLRAGPLGGYMANIAGRKGIRVRRIA